MADQSPVEHQDSAAETPTIRREVYFSGRVQGVGFRYTTRAIASGFSVGGYVKNLADGRVLLVAEGPEAEVGCLLNAVHRELGRFIRDENVVRPPPNGEFAGFEIRF